MQTRDHLSIRAARRELLDNGYRPLCQDPSTGIMPWQKQADGPALAIRIDRRGPEPRYHIVDFPEA